MKKANGLICLIISGVMFGMSPLIYHVAAILGSNNNTFLTIRCFIGIPVIIIILKLLKEPLIIPRKIFIDGCIAGFFSGACSLLMALSYEYIGGGMATTLHFIYPICVMAMNCLFYKEKFTPMKAVAAVWSTCGIVLFSYGETEGSLIGAILAILSGVAYAAHAICLEHSRVQFLHPLKTTLICTIFMGIVSLLCGKLFHSFDISQYTVGTLLFCLVPTFTVSICAQSLFQWGVSNTGATTGALLSTMELITATIIGFLFLHEELSLAKVLSCLCILFSVIVVVTEKKQASIKK